MLQVKPITAGELLSGRLDSRVLCGEETAVRIGRSGFSLGYFPSPGAQWREFPMTERAREAVERDPNVMLLGAYLDDRFIGQAAVVRTEVRWAEILDLRVDASSRRIGAGRMLLDACARFARNAGMAGLKVTTSDANPTMCQFCEHCGFTLQGIDRMALAASDQERIKPLLLRACALFFYLNIQKG